jgi:hypothetical protein
MNDNSKQVEAFVLNFDHLNFDIVGNLYPVICNFKNFALFYQDFTFRYLILNSFFLTGRFFCIIV